MTNALKPTDAEANARRLTASDGARGSARRLRPWSPARRARRARRTARGSEPAAHYLDVTRRFPSGRGFATRLYTPVARLPRERLSKATAGRSRLTRDYLL